MFLKNLFYKITMVVYSKTLLFLCTTFTTTLFGIIDENKKLFE